MSNARIRAAFESRLAAWAGAQVPPLPVVWQNVGGGLPECDHLRAFLLPAETVSRDLAGDNRSYRGVFQVSVFTLPNRGAGRAEKLAQALAELFPYPSLMDGGGLDVNVMSPMSAKPAVQEADWYSVPVSCRYMADEYVPRS